MNSTDRLGTYLRENQISFQTQHHPVAYTAQDVAASEHVPGNQVVKVVIVAADGKQAMLALPATHRVNLDKIARILGASHVQLAEERDFSDTFTDCELGAMSPFGNLYNVPVYVDQSLTGEEMIICEAGTHTDTISLAYADFARLVQPIVADFGERV